MASGFNEDENDDYEDEDDEDLPFKRKSRTPRKKATNDAGDLGFMLNFLVGKEEGLEMANELALLYPGIVIFIDFLNDYLTLSVYEIIQWKIQ